MQCDSAYIFKSKIVVTRKSYGERCVCSPTRVNKDEPMTTPMATTAVTKSKMTKTNSTTITEQKLIINSGCVYFNCFLSQPILKMIAMSQALLSKLNVLMMTKRWDISKNCDRKAIIFLYFRLYIRFSLIYCYRWSCRWKWNGTMYGIIENIQMAEKTNFIENTRTEHRQVV